MPHPSVTTADAGDDLRPSAHNSALMPISAASDAIIDEELIVLLESLEKQLDEAKVTNQDLEAAVEKIANERDKIETSLNAERKAVQKAKLKQAEAEAEVPTFFCFDLRVVHLQVVTAV